MKAASLELPAQLTGSRLESLLCPDSLVIEMTNIATGKEPLESSKFLGLPKPWEFYLLSEPSVCSLPKSYQLHKPPSYL